MTISEDFEELFGCLNNHEVQYLVIGAYAVAFHAKPRYTKDIDLFIAPTEDNARRILDALADFGFSGLNVETEDFVDPEMVCSLARPPNRINFDSSIEAVNK